MFEKLDDADTHAQKNNSSRVNNAWILYLPIDTTLLFMFGLMLKDVQQILSLRMGNVYESPLRCSKQNLFILLKVHARSPRPQNNVRKFNLE